MTPAPVVKPKTADDGQAVIQLESATRMV